LKEVTGGLKIPVFSKEQAIESRYYGGADAINRLIQELNKLPGIGPKSAQRIAYYLMRAPQEQAIQLAESILSIKQKIKLCSTCFNVTDADPCAICRNDQRNRTQVCVVEQPQDILAIEHTNVYHGLYHVLHGAISPTEGIGTTMSGSRNWRCGYKTVS